MLHNCHFHVSHRPEELDGGPLPEELELHKHTVVLDGGGERPPNSPQAACRWFEVRAVRVQSGMKRYSRLNPTPPRFSPAPAESRHKSKRSTRTGYSVSTTSTGVPGAKWFIGSTMAAPSPELVPPSDEVMISYWTVALPARPSP